MSKTPEEIAAEVFDAHPHLTRPRTNVVALIVKAIEADRAQRYGVIRCDHDWIDGACGAEALEGTPGWERRTSPKGDAYWLCPESAKQFPLAKPVPGILGGGSRNDGRR